MATRRIAVPGAHLFIATNPFLSDLLYAALRAAGWEKRGGVRLVQTLKGGDRPKNAEEEFSDVTVMPRSAGSRGASSGSPLTVACKTIFDGGKQGGLRRVSASRPFTDVIASERTPKRERESANHPSLKPQRFMREIVYSVLPLGSGRVLDPFMGGGSTIAAAEAVGYESIGIELDEQYFCVAEQAIPAYHAVRQSAIGVFLRVFG
jgi:site-specific DNA-methyltransferase (adenine-specific)